MPTKRDLQETLDLLFQALMRYSPCPKSDKKYYNRLRSILRRLSIHWHEKDKYLKSIAIPYKGPNKKIKTVYPCQICREQVIRSKGELDHIIPCGSLLKEEDETKFVKNLFCNSNGFRFLCKECHYKVTKESRKCAVFKIERI